MTFHDAHTPLPWSLPGGKRGDIFHKVLFASNKPNLHSTHWHLPLLQVQPVICHLQGTTPQPWAEGGLSCYTEATLVIYSRTFASRLVGVFTWKSEPISTGVLAHFTSHSRTIVSVKYDPGGDWEELVVCVGVYVWRRPQTEPQHGISLLLLPAPKPVIPLNIDAVALRPWDRWPPRSLFLSHSGAGSEPESRPAGPDGITDAKCTEAGTRDVGEKIRDSPRVLVSRKGPDDRNRSSCSPGTLLSHFTFTLQGQMSLGVSEMCHSYWGHSAWRQWEFKFLKGYCTTFFSFELSVLNMSNQLMI